MYSCAFYTLTVGKELRLLYIYWAFEKVGKPKRILEFPTFDGEKRERFFFSIRKGVLSFQVSRRRTVQRKDFSDNTNICS